MLCYAMLCHTTLYWWDRFSMKLSPDHCWQFGYNNNNNDDNNAANNHHTNNGNNNNDIYIYMYMVSVAGAPGASRPAFGRTPLQRPLSIPSLKLE